MKEQSEDIKAKFNKTIREAHAVSRRGMAAKMVITSFELQNSYSLVGLQSNFVLSNVHSQGYDCKGKFC